jgi:hypothetical protein
MNSTKKDIQKTSGTHKRYKQGQLYTYNRHIYQFALGPCSLCEITKDIWSMSIFCHICPPACCTKIIK